jgi:hypothetical protein
MSGRPEKDARQSKKPYVKPEVKQVPLTPEEAVLGGCKSPSNSGPLSSNCKPGGSPCSSQIS